MGGRPKHLSYILIPYSVLKSGLPVKEMCVLSNVLSIYHNGGVFRFDNKFIADYLDVHPKTASKHVNSLIHKGLLKSTQKLKPGSKEVAYRTLELTGKAIELYGSTPLHDNVDTPLHESVDTPSTKMGIPLHQNVEDNIISNNKSNNNKKKESLSKKIDQFVFRVKPFTDYKTYHDGFIDYWTELNPSGTKARFEDNKFFDIKRRLVTWKKNQDKWDNPIQDNDSYERLKQKYAN